MRSALIVAVAAISLRLGQAFVGGVSRVARHGAQHSQSRRRTLVMARKIDEEAAALGTSSDANATGKQKRGSKGKSSSKSSSKSSGSSGSSASAAATTAAASSSSASTAPPAAAAAAPGSNDEKMLEIARGPIANAGAFTVAEESEAGPAGLFTSSAGQNIFATGEFGTFDGAPESAEEGSEEDGRNRRERRAGNQLPSGSSEPRAVEREAALRVPRDDPLRQVRTHAVHCMQIACPSLLIRSDTHTRTRTRARACHLLCGRRRSPRKWSSSATLASPPRSRPPAT